MNLNGFYQMFDCDSEDAAVGAKWKEWIKGLEDYLKWVNVTDVERKIYVILCDKLKKYRNKKKI